MSINQSINSSNLSCPACKTANQLNARFCLNCGTAMNASPQTPYEPPATQAAPPMSQTIIYAGFWKRFFAYIIDAIIYTILFFIVVWFSFGIEQINSDKLEDIGLVYLLFYFGWWLYFTLLEGSSWQATIGKKVLGIIVSDSNGQPLSLFHAGGRQLAGVISSFTFSIGYLIAAFSARKQALHDMIARTVVTNNHFSPNQIQQVNQNPPPGMSAGAIIGVIMLVLALPAAGIIAAVAIPAYSQYTNRAQVFKAYQQANTVKQSLVSHAVETGYWPINFEQAGVDSQLMQNSDYYIQLQNNGVLAIVFNQQKQLANASLQLTPELTTSGNYVWQCQAFNMDFDYIPTDCQ